MEGSPPATIRAVSSAQWSLVVTTTKAEEFELGLVTSRQCFSLQSIFLIYRNFPEQLPTTFLCSPNNIFVLPQYATDWLVLFEKR